MVVKILRCYAPVADDQITQYLESGMGPQGLWKNMFRNLNKLNGSHLYCETEGSNQDCPNLLRGGEFSSNSELHES